MRTIEFEGARIAYDVAGEGTGLVLVHGTGGNAESNWGHLVWDLARNWKVVRPDYSGSGETRDAGGLLTIERLAGEVVAAAKAAGAAPFDLVGFSLGAAVAIKIAADYPELVRRVVLLGAFLDGKNPRQRMQFGLWNDLIRSDHAAMARLVLLTGLSPSFLSSLGDKGITESITAIVTGNNWEGMARQVDLDLSVDVAEAARRITKPVLVIGCTHDHMVPPSEVRSVAAAIPGARYAEMPTGHLAAIEQPAAFTALLREFLLKGQ